jgi:hypothetical protein
MGGADEHRDQRLAVPVIAVRFLVGTDALDELRRLRTELALLGARRPLASPGSTSRRPRTVFGVKAPGSANARLNAAEAQRSSRSAWAVCKVRGISDLHFVILIQQIAYNISKELRGPQFAYAGSVAPYGSESGRLRI